MRQQQRSFRQDKATLHEMKSKRLSEDNDTKIGRIIEERIKLIIEAKANAYSFDDEFNLENDDEDDNEIAPYIGPEPKVHFDSTRNIPFRSSFNQELNRMAQFKDGDTVTWQESNENIKTNNKYNKIQYHGTVIGQMGSVIKVLVDTYQLLRTAQHAVVDSGTLKRLPLPKVKFVISKQLKSEAVPPSPESARLVKHSRI